MDFKTYQVESRKTAQYPGLNESLDYPVMGLMGEFGELSEKFKKVLRDNNGELTQDRKEGVVGEIGDCCWYLFNIYSELEINLAVIYEETNVAKSISNTVHILVNMEYCITEICLFCVSRDKSCVDVFMESTNLLIDYLKYFCEKCNTTIEEVMDKNIEKLKSRKERNVIKGEGDNR